MALTHKQSELVMAAFDRYLISNNLEIKKGSKKYDLSLKIYTSIVTGKTTTDWWLEQLAKL